MPVMTGLSGNEMYCLNQKGLQAGDLVIGNSVFSVGFVGGIGSGLRTLAGGEVTQITSVIHDGRQQSYARMVAEAQKHGGIGITGVTNELIQHSGNIEFLSVGSCVHQEGRSEQLGFSSSADGQELYCQIDAGFRPIKFVFGNVAYSIGVGGGIMGALKRLQRGEVVQYSQVFNETRHPALPEQYRQNPISSDLTNEEMWNLIHLGYMPIQLVLGVSVYSLGLVGGITAAFKGLKR